MLVIAASVSVLIDSGFLVVTGSQVASGIAGAAIGPALSGITLGLVSQAGLPFQLGRNEAWNHAGNVGAAALAGAFGYRFGLPAVFVLMALMAAGSIVATLRIRPKDIDHDAARGLENGETDPAKGMAVLLKCKPLLLFGATLFLFHLANAAMLPLLSQAATAAKRADPSVYTAGTIVVSQIAMIPAALLASRFAQQRGYSELVLAALAILPLRGLIAALWRDPMGMIPVQVLDGVAAGLLGVATPGLVARILDGAGRFNTGLAGITALVGLGAALSTTLGGMIAKQAGYGAAFIGLASVAVLAFILFAASLPAFKPYASSALA